MLPDKVVIEAGTMVFAKYPNMRYRVATIVEVGDVFNGHGTLRPFSTLVTLEYLEDGTQASMPLSFFKSNWKSGTRPWGSAKVGKK